MPKRSKGHQKSRFRRSQKGTGKAAKTHVKMSPKTIKNPSKNRYKIYVEKISENDVEMIENGSPKGSQNPKNRKNGVSESDRKMLEKHEKRSHGVQGLRHPLNHQET